jgi:PAS domain S-box-containing protein
MADSTLSYEELLRENASLRDQLAEREAYAELRRRAEEQARVGERLRRVAAESALRESEARYRTLADTMPQVVFIATASGFVEYVNKPGLEYMGLRLDEAIGFGWLGAIHPDDRQLVADRWLECLNIGKTYEFEHRLLRADGQYRWQLARAVPIGGETGAIVRWIGTSTDIHDHRQAEEDLRESRTEAERHAEELDRLYQTSPAGLAFIDPDLRFVRINQTLADINGFPVEAYLGRTLREMLSPALADRLEPVLRRVVQEGEAAMNVEMEGEAPAEPGHHRYWLANYYPLKRRDGAVLGVNVVVQDITQRRLAEDALRRNEELLRLVTDSSPMSMLYCDEQQRLRFVNRAYVDWLGVSSDEVIGKALVDVLGAQAYESIRPYVEAALLGTRSDFEAPVPYERMGTRFMRCAYVPHIDESGRTIGFTAVKIDITERRRMEEALRESEERLRLALGAGQMGAWDVDLATDLTRWDRKEFALLGIAEGAVTPSPDEFYRRVHPDDLPLVQESVRKAIEETGALEQEFRVVRPDGEIRWLAAKGQVLNDNGGRPVRMVGVNFDVTQRRQTEERLRSFTQELEARVAERTLELTQLHARLRALTTELNLTEQRERKRLATDLHDYLTQLLALVCMKLGQIRRLAPQIAQTEIAQTEGVVNEALIYTRTLIAQLSPPVLHEFGLPVALRWLAEQMIRQELSVEVRQLVPDRVPVPEDQAVLLFQSVRELLINVRKHARTHQAVMTIEQSDSDLCITVRDEGVGADIAAATATNQLSVSSSRFGLFSIRERMLAIGGRLEIESSPGRGMTSRLTLPLDASEANEHGMMGAQLSHPHRDGECQLEAGARIKVLLVDDHPMIREGLRGLLYVHEDLTIVGEACDGEEALSLTDKLRPDCVIMDVNMPRMDGIEATRRLKAAFGGTAVIGLSVNTSREVEEAMRRAGVDQFLSKEAPVEEIYRTILVAAGRTRE